MHYFPFLKIMKLSSKVFTNPHIRAELSKLAKAANLKSEVLIRAVSTRWNTVSMVLTRALEMRITSGSDRVWSSADCVGGDGATKLHRLERGVPFVRSISWNRHRSGKDCSAAHPEAKAGTYVATAVAGSLTSEKTVFHLR